MRLRLTASFSDFFDMVIPSLAGLSECFLSDSLAVATSAEKFFECSLLQRFWIAENSELLRILDDLGKDIAVKSNGVLVIASYSLRKKALCGKGAIMPPDATNR